MEILIFIGGLILGVALTMLYKARERIHGIIHVDHNTEQCIVNLRSEELMDRKKKIAVFILNHEADISRE